jgi:hypothetical protein
MKKFITKNGVTSQSQSLSGGKSNSEQATRPVVGRRTFLKGLGATGAVLLPGSALLMSKAQAQEMTKKKDDDSGGQLTKGDAAILSFVAAAEILESDLWEQYWELGGLQANDFASTNPATGFAPPLTGGNSPYTGALKILDGDMDQYILDNTDDEFSHANFLLAYLKSKGADTSDVERLFGTEFRTLQGSMATGSAKKGRLTNLMQLKVDTSFWSRYRSDAHNPDLPDGFTFPQAVLGLNNGEHPAIPRSDADTAGSTFVLNPDGSVDASKITDHLKGIAFTAGFHFAFIEIGGTSLYPELAQRVSNVEVLRILLSIGPTEAMHFQTWQDKAGNALPVSVDGLIFADLHASTDELLQANLIMPEPTPFLSTNFPICSIVRPTQTEGAAMGAAAALTADGLFTGQSTDFFALLADLASDADAARRENDDHDHHNHDHDH